MIKVLGVGLPRTGTQSLVEALTILGYNALHEPFTKQFDANQAARPADFRKLLGAVSSDCGAVTEPTCWRMLCEAYPAAKIILTIRGPEAWFRSVRAHIDAIHTGRNGREDCTIEESDRITERLFGSRWPQKGLYIEKYRQHELLVQAVCADRELLRFDVREGWGPLCEFLGKPVPEMLFPWANRLVS